MSDEHTQDPAPAATVAEVVSEAERHELRAAFLDVERWRSQVALWKTRIENARLVQAAAERGLDQAAAQLQLAERAHDVLKVALRTRHGATEINMANGAIARGAPLKAVE